jgi:hypothetical protein
MRLNSVSLAGGLLLTWSVLAGPDPIYINNGNVTDAPVIDATVFVNSGTFGSDAQFFTIGGLNFLSSGQPYSTQNTLYYTNLNSGRMTADVGFEFDYATETARFPAASFVNYGNIDGGTYLLVTATNVFNSGVLLASEQGLIQIKGQSVNLSRSGLRTGTPLTGGGTTIPGSGTAAGVNFNNGDQVVYIDPQGVSEVYWGIGENGRFRGNDGTLAEGAGAPLQLAQLNTPNPRSQRHEVVNSSGRTNSVTVPSVTQGPFAAFAFTNMLTSTNPIIQVVFVPTNYVDTNFSVNVRFSPSQADNAIPNTQVAMVQLSLWDIDAVTGLPFTNWLYFADRMATTTNYIVVTNLVNQNVAKPLPYEVTQAPPVEWTGGKTNNTVFTNTLLADPKYLNRAVTNNYAAFSVTVGSDTSTSGSGGFVGGRYFGFFNTTSASDPTNRPGRIEIEANNLDLNLTRMRSEGLVTIKTPNYLGGAPAKLDAPLFTFDIGSTNGFLSVSNVVPVSVRRFRGLVNAWSASWTNQVESVEPGATPEEASVTNYVDYVFHSLILEPSFNTIIPVEIRDFAMRSDNLVELRDRLVVGSSLSVEAPNLYIGNILSLSALGDVGATNFVNVMNLTNAGTLTVNNLMNLGTDRPIPYSNVVNRGQMAASSVQIAADFIDNAGTISASRGTISLASKATKFEKAEAHANGDLLISGNEFKVRQSVLTSGTLTTNAGQPVYQPGTMFLTVTNLLSDGDSTASNRWTTVGGIQMRYKPATADLLGTGLTSLAQQYSEVLHVWAGADLGTVPEAFTNNAALGRLTLEGNFNSLYTFSGAGASNALYVDYLELKSYTSNYLSSLQINPGMRLYFGAANLPAETLDGSFDGRLRWVRSYAGALSGTNVVLSSNQVIRVNRSLLASTTIDSDGDGVPNGQDARPFDGVRLSVGLTNEPVSSVLLSWKPAAETLYQVDYSTNVITPEWKRLISVVSGTNANEHVVVADPLAGSGPERYYRVTYTP